MSDPMTEDAQPSVTPRVRPRRRLIRGIALAAVILVVGAGATWLLWPQPDAAPAATQNYTATRGTQTLTVGLTGTLSPQTQASLSFTVSGTVTDVYVSAGDTVKKGARLARIDDGDLRDALALARANLDTARANLDDVEDSGTAAAQTAARAQVRSARAAVAAAEDDLGNAVLRATITGTVAAVELSVGDTVTGGGATRQTQGFGQPTTATTTSHVVVVSTDAWRLDGTVGSADLAALSTGQPATVQPDGAAAPIDAAVASVGIVATSSQDGSATFPVVLHLSGTHPELFSGTTATATITVAQYPDVLTVPTIAIGTRDGRPVVTRVSGATLQEVEVTTGRVFGAATEILSGLAAGDTVQVSFETPQPQRSRGGMFGPPPGVQRDDPADGGSPAPGEPPAGQGGANR